MKPRTTPKQSKKSVVLPVSVPVAPKATRRTKTAPATVIPSQEPTPSVPEIPTVTGDSTVTTSATQPPVVATSNPMPPDVADEPPTLTLPPVPGDFSPVAMSSFRGHYPNKLELSAMPKAMGDLGRFVNYAALLGGAAPAASAVVATVDRALDWREIRDSMEAFSAYVKAEDGIAWKSAMNMLDEVRPLFAFAASKDPSLITAYPWLAQLLAASKAPALKAVASRMKKAKSDAATAAATATAVAVAAATAEATAKAPTPATPKSVTVNA
jgi:hypothetical protein